MKEKIKKIWLIGWEEKKIMLVENQIEINYTKDDS